MTTELTEPAGHEERASHHFGRSFGGPAHLEWDCPCTKAPCGLVAQVDPGCAEHPWTRMKTIRVSHSPEHCPGESMARIGRERRERFATIIGYSPGNDVYQEDQ